MKRDDGISIILSIVINVIIVLLIPSLSTQRVENKKIKVGLVAYENKSKAKLEGKKNSNSPEKKITQEIKKKPSTPKEKTPEVKKPVEKKKEEKKVEKKPSNQIDLNALNSIATNLSTPQVEVLAKVEPVKAHREIKKIETPKKKFAQGGGVTSNGNLIENITLSKEIIPSENERFELVEDEKISFNSEMGSDISFDRILQIEGESDGLPSGYKLGTEDGDIVARWDSSNREPVYPESAQLKGLHGSVRLRMEIDESGNVRALHMEKGSGVPEINSAIEKVGRTWKIYLSKNGLSVKGSVILEYNFVLKGKVD